MNDHQNVGVENAFDVRKEIARARLSATLQAIELVRIRSTLSSSRELKKSILRATSKSKILSKQAKTIVDLPELEDDIDRCLNDQAEVLSTASKILAELRDQIKYTNSELLQKLEHITNSPNNIKFLQESIVTQRSDRYVI